ncbi:DUF2218 domain-containing protein [Nitratireductor kimnyeongensis]|uniref:DUF2218 domain-containing protein n=1 Tax=Nitratireductor kimnyeongensis TaxID=430679 RepID=A0ABW0T5Y0_9HYPH|nr:DUF2218 domain-containing protein [Nitratireductor kimnyeongensis]QZZ34459.1 DUF2218 domain-containing protein [Nitratireductor kimnyeongensis]
MMQSKAVVTTENASKYLQQLCKHFAHKVSVDFDTSRGKVGFPFGDCTMSADEAALTIECTAKTDEELARAQNVIDDHLTRFAWREKPEISWQA